MPKFRNDAWYDWWSLIKKRNSLITEGDTMKA